MFGDSSLPTTPNTVEEVQEHRRKVAEEHDELMKRANSNQIELEHSANVLSLRQHLNSSSSFLSSIFIQLQNFEITLDTFMESSLTLNKISSLIEDQRLTSDQLRAEASTIIESDDNSSPELTTLLEEHDNIWMSVNSRYSEVHSKVSGCQSYKKVCDSWEALTTWIDCKITALVNLQSIKSSESTPCVLYDMQNLNEESAVKEKALIQLLEEFDVYKNHFFADDVETMKREISEQWAYFKDLLSNVNSQVGDMVATREIFRKIELATSYYNQIEHFYSSEYDFSSSLDFLSANKLQYESEYIKLRHDVADLFHDIDQLADRCYHEEKLKIIKLLKGLESNFNHIDQISAEFNVRIQSAIDWREFLKFVDENQLWLSKMRLSLTELKNSDCENSDVLQLCVFADMAKSYFTEINGKEETYNSLMTIAYKFDFDSQTTAEKIKEEYDCLRVDAQLLYNSIMLDLNYLNYQNTLSILENWISIQNENLESIASARNTNVDSCRAQIRYLEFLDASILRKFSSIQEFVDLGKKLCEDDHPNKEYIVISYDNLVDKYNSLKSELLHLLESLSKFVESLGFESELEVFCGCLEDMSDLLNAEFNLSSENLPLLNSRHRRLVENFEGWRQFFNRLDAITDDYLTENKLTDFEYLKSKIATIQQKWANISSSIDDRTQIIDDALAEFEFNVDVNYINNWMDRIERILKEEINIDTVTNMVSMTARCQYVQRLLTDIHNRLEEFRHHIDNMINHHPNSQNINQRYCDLKTRLEKLFNSLEQYKLDTESFKRGQFLRLSYNDVMVWMDNLNARLKSEFCGSNMTENEDLIKENDLIEENIKSYQQLTHNLSKNVDSDCDSFYCQRTAFQEKITELGNHWDELLKNYNARKDRLEQAQEILKIYYGAKSAEIWLKEINDSFTPLNVNNEKVHNLQFERIKELSSELENSKAYIERLAEQGQSCKMQSLQISKPIEKAFVADDFIPKYLNQPEFTRGECVNILSRNDPKWAKVELSSGATSNSGYLPTSLLMPFNEEQVDQITISIPEIQGNLNETYSLVLNNYNSAFEQMTKISTSYNLRKRALELMDQIDTGKASTHKADDQLNETGQETITRYNNARNLKETIKNSKLEIENLHQEFSRINNDNVNAPVLLELENALGSLNTSCFEAEMESEQVLQTLSKDSEIKLYYDDVEKINIWLNDHENAVFSTDKGFDIESCIQIRKEYVTIHRAFVMMNQQIAPLENRSLELLEKYPEDCEEIQLVQTNFTERWNKFVTTIEKREQNLLTELTWFRFIDLHNTLRTWLDGVSDRISANEGISSFEDLKQEMQSHKVLRVEIDSYGFLMDIFETHAVEISKNDCEHAEEVNKIIHSFCTSRDDLESLWEDRYNILLTVVDYKTFCKDCSDFEDLIKLRTDELNNADYVKYLFNNRTPSGVSASDLVQKIGTARLDELSSQADEFVFGCHYASDEILGIKANLQQKWKGLCELTSRIGNVTHENEFDSFISQLTEVENHLDCLYVLVNSPVPSDLQKVNEKLSLVQSAKDCIKNDDLGFQSLKEKAQNLIDSGSCNGYEEAVHAKIRDLTESMNNMSCKLDEYQNKCDNVQLEQKYTTELKFLDNLLNFHEAMLSSQPQASDRVALLQFVDRVEMINYTMESYVSPLVEELNRDILAKSGRLGMDLNVVVNPINLKYEKVEALCQSQKEEKKILLNIALVCYHADDSLGFTKKTQEVLSSLGSGNDIESIKQFIYLLQKIKSRIEEKERNHDCIVTNIEICNISQVISADPDNIIRTRLNDMHELLNEYNTEKDKLHTELMTLENKYNYDLSFYTFIDEMDKNSLWIGRQLSFLRDGNYGDSLCAVERLLKNIGKFKIMLESRGSALEELYSTGRDLQMNGETTLEIEDKICNLNSQYSELKSALSEYSQNVENSRIVLNFMAECGRVNNWIDYNVKYLQQQSEALETNFAWKASLAKQDRFERKLSRFKDQILSQLAHHMENITEQMTESSHQCYAHTLQLWDQLNVASSQHRQQIIDKSNESQNKNEMLYQYAKNALAFNTWVELSLKELGFAISCISLQEAESLADNHHEFLEVCTQKEIDVQNLDELHERIMEFGGDLSYYQSPTIGEINENWSKILSESHQRTLLINSEIDNQKRNDETLKKFISYSTDLDRWIIHVRKQLLFSDDDLDTQLVQTQKIASEARSKKQQLMTIQKLGDILQTCLPNDNNMALKAVGLKHKYEHLVAFVSRIHASLREHIRARSYSGVSEKVMKEFNLMFLHYDVGKTGKLNHEDFFSCLRALGTTLPDDQNIACPVYQEILNQVDPKRRGYVTMQEFMAYMVSRESLIAHSSAEVEEAFRFIAKGRTEYVSCDELYSSLPADLADHCVTHMAKYVDGDGNVVDSCYDYRHFSGYLFAS